MLLSVDFRVLLAAAMLGLKVYLGWRKVFGVSVSESVRCWRF